MAGIGSKPGERRGGRKKGVPNKVNAGLKAAFQKHETALVKALVELTKSKDLDIRLKALQTCFDRGWGKPAQPLTGEDAEGPAIVQIRHIIVDAEERPQPGHQNGKDIQPPA